MDVELMEVEDPRWKEELAAQRHDFYHLPDYLKLCATSASGRPVALYARSGEGRLLVPLILRDIDGHGIPECAGLRDAISPYGYPGPLVVLPPGPPEQGREFLVQALAAGIGLLREQRIVSAFIRSHPLLGFDTAVFAKAGEVVHHGETVSIDTTLDEAGRWSQIRNDHRSGIKKALLSGQVVEFDDQWRELDAFVSIYNQTMGRVSASAGYFFPREYYLQLRDALAGRLHLVINRIGGEVAAAALFTEVGGIVQYHLSGTAEQHRKAYPSKLILHHVAGWAHQRGRQCLHLGGGLGGETDSLFLFKAGFSARRHPFHTLRVDTEPGIYASLVDIAEQKRAPGSTISSSFFPRYRHP
jgi:hypothetical protein